MLAIFRELVCVCVISVLRMFSNWDICCFLCVAWLFAGYMQTFHTFIGIMHACFARFIQAWCFYMHVCRFRVFLLFVDVGFYRFDVGFECFYVVLIRDQGPGRWGQDRAAYDAEAFASSFLMLPTGHGNCTHFNRASITLFKCWTTPPDTKSSRYQW